MDQDVQEALRNGEVDLEIEEALRSMDEYLDNLDPADRTLVIMYLRWTYLDGYVAGFTDCNEGTTRLGLFLDAIPLDR